MAESAMPYGWVHNKPRATRHQLRWGIEPHLAKINTHTPKIEHTPSQTTETQNQTHTTDTETLAQYTSEGDPAHGVTPPDTTQTTQIRAMQTLKPLCSTPMKETQHKRAQNKNRTNTMPRLGPCSTKPPCSTPIRETQHRRTQHRTYKMPRLGPWNANRQSTVTGQGKGDHQRQWRRLHGHPTDGGRSDDGEQTEIA